MNPADLPLWAVGPGRLPRLVGIARADVCVVGLGGSGLSAAARLVAAGRRVVGIDAGGIAAGASGRNGGFLMAGPSMFHHRLKTMVGTELARSFYELTLEIRDRLLTEIPGADPRGSLRAPATPEEVSDARAQLEALNADGFEAEWIRSPREGLLVRGDGVFDPGRRCRALADRIADHCRLYGDSPALSIEPERVRTPAGEIRAEVVLVAVDGGLERVLPALAEPGEGRPAVRTRRLQMLATAPAPDVHEPHAVYYRGGYDYWQQRPDGRIALGGGRDRDDEADPTETGGAPADGGAGPAPSRRGPARAGGGPGAGPARAGGGPGADGDALAVTPVVQAHLERILREVVGTRAAITHRWLGTVGYSSDRLPWADEVAPGVFACGAYSGTGNVVGVGAAEALAELALGRPLPSLIRWLRRARASVRLDGGEGGGPGGTAPGRGSTEKVEGDR